MQVKMTRRFRGTTQSRHDSAVKRVAGGFKSQGWKVRADVRGHVPPRTIYGRRPDVIATKGAKTRVVEVETPGTYRRDSTQRSAFKRWTSQSPKRKFRTKIAR